MPSNIDIQTSEKDAKAAALRKERMLENLGSGLETKFSKYSSDRSAKETEWINAIRQYEGEWSSEERTKIESALWGNNDRHVPPPVNITRPKTNMAISRMQDSQFPVGGDYNFTLAPSPMPEMLRAAQSMEDPDPTMAAEAAAAGIPPDEVPSPRDIVQDIAEEAANAAILMTAEIQDDLVRTKYGQKARLAIEDLAILGAAVIKGPVLTPHVRRVYQPEVTSTGETIQVMGAIVEHKADSFRVDPRLVYPDPSARMPDEIEDIFELHIMTKTQVAKLAEGPSFMRGQIVKVLEAGTDITDLPTSITSTSYLNSGVVTDNRYVVKEYHGPIDKQVLLDGELISEEDAEDELATFFGEVWFCNGTVIRLSLSYLEGLTTIPYGIAAWERDPSSVFGHGIPYLIRNPQQVVNNAYLLLLDNASLTSGPQIVLNKEMIEPASKDGNYDIAPMKVWFLTEYGADVREAMQFVNVPAQMDGIANIIDMAMQFSDMESATPLMQQGDLPAGNNALTGVGKIMSATNINQKRASMNWDDYITIPHMERYYHHQMQYGSNEDAKGDLEVKIGGATERIDSEIRAQELERLLGISSANPDYLIQINPVKAFRQLATLIRGGDILRTPTEVEEERARQQEEAANSQQSDPAAMTAQAHLMTAQAKMQAGELDAQVKQQEMQLNQFRMQLDARQLEIDAQARARRDAVEMQIKQDEREMSMIKLASEQDMSVKQLAQQLQIAIVNNQKDREKIAADMYRFNTEVSLKQQMGEGI